jgi:hypothetical protein
MGLIVNISLVMFHAKSLRRKERFDRWVNDHGFLLLDLRMLVEVVKLEQFCLPF